MVIIGGTILMVMEDGQRVTVIDMVVLFILTALKTVGNILTEETD